MFYHVINALESTVQRLNASFCIEGFKCLSRRLHEIVCKKNSDCFIVTLLWVDLSRRVTHYCVVKNIHVVSQKTFFLGFSRKSEETLQNVKKILKKCLFINLVVSENKCLYVYMCLAIDIFSELHFSLHLSIKSLHFVFYILSIYIIIRKYNQVLRRKWTWILLFFFSLK